ncbi:ATP-binding cassette sub-family G member 5 isoform X2 [Halyomorpha halys]|uniref:ATP-binding cassette sub-family G member 5 isoform X2 n=1 Tax=Halyomorpha halys TaxID=286706 RepID=UPI0006D4CF51|nr:ATP-binding cassette sub-family G member 5 isoform X2 [Halyomorpha halys]
MPCTSVALLRQNLNSDFTDSALGSSEKSPLPYGNFQLRESTVQSILNHPRYGPKSPLGANMYTYLKFGLPRVFPPNGKKETSSGYDSSEEGTRREIDAQHLRSRSVADFNSLHHLHHQGHGLVSNGRGKSLSQANLLSPETALHRAQAAHRASLHDLRRDHYHHHSLHHIPQHPPPPNHHTPLHQPRLRRASVVTPQHQYPPPEPFSFVALHPQQYTGLYPHLQVRNMNIRDKKGEPLVNNLSLEVKAGEILSIMATSEKSGKALLSALSGRHGYTGQISLNGQAVGPSDLLKRVALARSDTVLPPDLSVISCLRYYARLRRPRSKVHTSQQVSIVTEELGLSPVLETRVSELTRSEISRLLIALQLLSDPLLLCIEDLTQPMDIFDTFFLVEFLRHWASGATGGVRGRVVVMCLQPPTYEILTMVPRLLALSGPEPVFTGASRALVRYFTSVDYPCPPFKNPADYYLDLVTLDDLSAEAMLESSQRVDQLSALYRRRQEPLSEPQPHTIGPGFIRAGFFGQPFAIILKETVYSQPACFARWICRVVISALVSVVIGSVFWDIPTEDQQLTKGDRLGYQFTMVCLASWPGALWLGLDGCFGRRRQSAESDIKSGHYSGFLYSFVTMMLNIIPSVLIWCAYLIPAYCMSGLYGQGSTDSLLAYLGYSLTGLLCLQYLARFLGYITGCWLWPTIIFCFVSSTASLGAGFALHPSTWSGVWGPLGNSYIALVKEDHSHSVLAAINSHLVCRNKQIQKQDIIVQLPCPVPNGTVILSNHGLNVPQHTVSTFSWLIGAFIACIVTFLIATCFGRKRRSK